MGVLVTLVQAAVAFPKVQDRVCAALERAFEVPMHGHGGEKEANVFAALVLHIRTFKVIYLFSILGQSIIMQEIC